MRSFHGIIGARTMDDSDGVNLWRSHFSMMTAKDAKKIDDQVHLASAHFRFRLSFSQFITTSPESSIDLPSWDMR